MNAKDKGQELFKNDLNKEIADIPNFHFWLGGFLTSTPTAEVILSK